VHRMLPARCAKWRQCPNDAITSAFAFF